VAADSRKGYKKRENFLILGKGQGILEKRSSMGKHTIGGKTGEGYNRAEESSQRGEQYLERDS